MKDEDWARAHMKGWEKLDSLYRIRLLTNKLFLKDELLNCSIDEGGDITEHLNGSHKLFFVWL